ncbi:MAG: heparan-alpha-glucosaminide N-acetyltransferase domain-containing protein [Myxococcota bacterium]
MKDRCKFPTFLFLSGTSLAMSFEKRRRAGAREFDLDRHLLIRAAVIFAGEGLLSMMSGMGEPFLQVLFAIGASMVAMVLLRRLPTVLLVLLGLAWLGGSEWILMEFFPVGEIAPSRPVLELLFLTAGAKGGLLVYYPMTHWLAMMLLGWAFGKLLATRPATQKGSEETEKMLLLSGLSALLGWAFLRSANGYGNLGLFRDDTTIVQWLHMSKYPPALVYSLMELGLMALLLVFFMRIERRMKRPASPNHPLLVFGQTALFFYMAHMFILGGSAVAWTGGIALRGLSETYLVAGLTVILLYPACLGYRALKKRHPKSLLQYF